MRAIGTKRLLCSLLVLLALASYFNLFSISFSPLLSRSHYELYTVCCSAAERAPFPHRWLFWGAGKLDATVLIFFFFLLAMAGAEVGENYTRRPNRSLLSKALQMHLSELNTYELCTGVGDDSTVTGADGRRGGRETETESDTQVWMHRTRSRTATHTLRRTHKQKKKTVTHIHTRSSIKSKCHWRQDHGKIH